MPCSGQPHGKAHLAVSVLTDRTYVYLTILERCESVLTMESYVAFGTNRGHVGLEAEFISHNTMHAWSL